LCTKLILFLLILCLLLFGTFRLTLETEKLEQDCIRLQDELQEIRAENEALACRLAELRELQAIREEQVVWRE